MYKIKIKDYLIHTVNNIRLFYLTLIVFYSGQETIPES